MRILVVEDDPVSALFLRKTLEHWGHEVTLAANGAQAWELFRAESFRLVISDWIMPAMDGLELSRRIRAQADPFYTYVILFTGKIPREHRVEGLQAGADDFLEKPVNPVELMAHLEVAQRILGMEDQLQSRTRALEAVNADLARQAITDSLTNLKNRRHFQEVLHASVSFARRHMLPLSLLLLDVDRFKNYNDTYGHQAGDAVLRALAGLLQANVRIEDEVARYGGEEFAILLPGTDASGAMLMAERLRVTVETYPWSHPPVTISIGVSALTMRVADPDVLVHASDQALYQSKARGRNCVTLYSDPVPQGS